MTTRRFALLVAVFLAGFGVCYFTQPQVGLGPTPKGFPERITLVRPLQDGGPATVLSPSRVYRQGTEAPREDGLWRILLHCADGTWIVDARDIGSIGP